MMDIQAGRYRHYKGQDYDVLTLAIHTETGEKFVVYRALYGEYDVWIRPLEMFTEQVVYEGQTVPRFTRLLD